MDARGSMRESSFPFYPILKIPKRSTISSSFMSSEIWEESASNSAIPARSDRQYEESSIFCVVQGSIAAY